MWTTEALQPLSRTPRRRCLPAQDRRRRRRLAAPARWLAARYGEEQLIILLPAPDEAGSLLIAEHIRQAVAVLRIPHTAYAHDIVTVSAGACVLTPTGGDDKLSDLIAAAGRALYQAKLAGRNLLGAALST